MKNKKVFEIMDKAFFVFVIIFHAVSMIQFIIKNEIDEAVLCSEIIVLAYSILVNKYTQWLINQRYNEEEI